ncbi:1-acyl-sn-glycerol-3-phosphate acyltransferase [Leptospira perolatii]|uniref:1-acyl-sn-glycerol-3-phosphate acyltransferase n=1 Tax=Leptospira perolatii TaxID=2023191 RepID=A0A2M9ZPY7_9LEPT|nr:lysophospholipid acyltransferase family protein [Leptospira perolatii]PJZ69046.1 1-acyl-sn-glycerol-3-phosphate acyltransferase [Leptospira perolatii]PJZ74085.1 1-acyl-sn-glycerol-3-phosphate acyltransferase [Leptospira perolatii]
MDKQTPEIGELDSLFLIPRDYAKLFLKNLLHLIYDVEVEGTENVPKDGGGVIVSNHTDNLDVIVQGTSVERKIIYLGKYELFHPQETLVELLDGENSPFKFFPLSLVRTTIVTALNLIGSYQGKTLLNWGGYPILRSHNVTDAKSAAKYYESLEDYMVDLVKSGELISVYPEGTRTEDGSMGSFKALTAKIAIRAGVPIIPSGIRGAWKMMKPETFLSGRAFRTKILYRIGKPIFPESFPQGPLKRAAKLLTEELEQRVQELVGGNQNDPL